MSGVIWHVLCGPTHTLPAQGTGTPFSLPTWNTVPAQLFMAAAPANVTNSALPPSVTR